MKYQAIIPILLLCGAAAAGAQPVTPLRVTGKLKLHAVETASPGFVVETAAYAGVLHWMDTPREWGQGGSAYGKRVASAAGATAIRNVFAFGLDAALREDPRYYPAGHGAIFRRMGHVVRETFVTHTDSGGRRFATWRFGSAVGAACLSNVWYPDRYHTVSSGLEQGAATIGLDLMGNFASEFWPDIKRTVFRRR